MYSAEIRKYFENLSRKLGKKKARAVLRHRIAVAVYYTLKRNEPFNLEKFLQTTKRKEKAV